MSAARLRCVNDADFEEIGDQRRADRRSRDRRAGRLRFDWVFAATLVNQIARPEALSVRPYPACSRGPRAGLVVNVRA
jgi:hypothetical protein